MSANGQSEHDRAAWYVRLLGAALEETGDVSEAVLAADLALSLEPTPVVVKTDPPTGIALAFDIFDRKAQGVLNKALKAAKRLQGSARRELVNALSETDPAVLSQRLLKSINDYRVQLADLLGSTQLAALLQGAREVAGKVPVVLPAGAGVPPPTLSPAEALAHVNRLRLLPMQERVTYLYNLPADQQAYVRTLLTLEPARPAPPTFAPLAPRPGAPETVHFPTIDEAVRLLASKQVLTRDDYNRLDQASRQKAFTVARVDSEEALTRIRDALVENVREGADLATFREKVLSSVDEGTFLSPGHLETVFRAGVQGAFSDGQMRVLGHPAVRSGFPYAAYDAIHDDRVRDEHLAMEKNGIQSTNIYRVDDPVFQTFRAPWDWNCRCGWTPITVKQAAENGIEEARQWLDTGSEPSPPAFVPMPPFAPPADFQRAVENAPLSVRLAVEVPINPDFEREHPRDEDGRFLPPDGVGKAAESPTGPPPGVAAERVMPESKAKGKTKGGKRGRARRRLNRGLRVRRKWLPDGGAMFAAGPNPWVSYTGPRGGKGWKNSTTGRVVYQANQPGTRGAAAPATPAAPGTRAKRAGPKSTRADPAAVKARIAALLQNPSTITAADIDQVKEDLLSMTVADITQVKKDLGLKASGAKATLVDKVVARALAKPPPAATPAPPPSPPPTPAAPPATPGKLDLGDPAAVQKELEDSIKLMGWRHSSQHGNIYSSILGSISQGFTARRDILRGALARQAGIAPNIASTPAVQNALDALIVASLTALDQKQKAPATQATPAPAPSVLHPGSNVITGKPAGATKPDAGLPAAQPGGEIEWSTGKAQPGTLNGVDFKPAPHHFWEHTKDVDVGEPPPLKKVNRVGIMVQEPDGRIWIVKPTNGYGKRNYTMPGGGVEPGLSDQQNALKEFWEETGLQVEITGHLGDFEDSNNLNNGRLYIGKRIGGAPWDAKVESFIINQKTGKPDAESSEVVLVTPERAAKLLHRTDDLAQLMTVAPIPVDTPTRGTGSGAMQKFVAAVKPKAEAYRKAKQSAGDSPGNAELHAVQELRGFNKKPKVVGKKDMDALVKQGGHIEVLRGVKPVGGKTAKELVDQYKTGDHYPGYGIFGSGTYADSNRGHSNIASQYAGYSGAMMRMAIPKSAKIVKFSELERKVPQQPALFTDHGNTSNAGEDWRGVQAALAGYDVIHMDKPGYGQDFYVVLNRGVVTVQEEDATGHVIR